MTQMVLLLHQLPNGSSHYDWMIQRRTPDRVGGAGPGPQPNSEARNLITFRVSERIDQSETSIFSAYRLDDHRAAYLEYQGLLSDGRGQVTRVAVGLVHALEETPAALTIHGCFGNDDQRLWTGCLRDDAWRFERR